MVKPVLINVIPDVLIVVKSFAGTFAETPPPVKYLTVKVVFEGAIPYEFVKIKLVGFLLRKLQKFIVIF